MGARAPVPPSPEAPRPTDRQRLHRSVHGRLRAERLNANWFMSFADAREKFEDWRTYYNEERPHGAIGNLTPITLQNCDGATSPAIVKEGRKIESQPTQTSVAEQKPENSSIRRSNIGLGSYSGLVRPVAVLPLPAISPTVSASTLPSGTLKFLPPPCPGNLSPFLRRIAFDGEAALGQRAPVMHGDRAATERRD